ncbi:MAG: septal ring lytic transglycosylase RlpA family protein [Candidatus Contendobacter sp.]|nr:septal ring lytic transglycosylase RlpA family protein [Candidatus Contendobacter sp.]MCU0811814.1 septal ring lytic transglycosylase RlpA family protein [Thiobacillaceae bacterium]
MNEHNQRHALLRRTRRALGVVSSIVLPATLALAAIPLEAGARNIQTGQASWYGPGFHGKKTASGERFNQHALTAAHRSLPLGTRARVTNLRNGKAILVKINDRGPYHGGRVIDLSRAAARHLAMGGIGRVRIEAMP